MFIAHVTFTTSAADRFTAIATLRAEAATVRAMSGCIAFTPFADGTTGIGILHEWQSAEAFAAYTTSPTFAETGRTLRPLMTAPPVSKRFDATLIEAVD
ncbi:putative quinol monooxygenase [Algicella marina]|uniref:Antibiotic biosynthesis monooxygenase n=1 Tax=Algicella marina TaxID=2683284 RepID=A0A6P1T2F1_9RHOB|nr:antibiotic biosynthesis monooxygenase [Algicella marina]QHQ35833.1 antibiotic biosynthesis monooxygenase [Algicella marina]